MKRVHTLRVAPDHPAFTGHFPGIPILPGALVLDEVLHFILEDRGLDLSHWQITAAKFLAAVRPGDLLAIEHGGASDGTLKFAARVADRPVLSGALMRLPSPEAAP